jgi:hypothetical protein
VLVLEALAWLGGDHRTDLSPTPSNICIEDLETAKLVAAIRQRPAVRQRLGRLARSDNAWIRQATKLALDQMPK